MVSDASVLPTRRLVPVSVMCAAPMTTLTRAVFMSHYYRLCCTTLWDGLCVVLGRVVFAAVLGLVDAVLSVFTDE